MATAKKATPTPTPTPAPKKAAAPKKTAAPKKAASPKKPRFPKKELNAWLRTHVTWNHEDWLALLTDLKAAGFADYTDTPEGQDEIGLYLENNRKSV